MMKIELHNLDLVDASEITVRPLTLAEKRWVVELENVLARMPKRLLLLEIAGLLEVIDRAAALDIDIEDGKARRAGIVLAYLRNGFNAVQGVSG